MIGFDGISDLTQEATEMEKRGLLGKAISILELVAEHASDPSFIEIYGDPLLNGREIKRYGYSPDSVLFNTHLKLARLYSNTGADSKARASVETARSLLSAVQKLGIPPEQPDGFWNKTEHAVRQADRHGPLGSELARVNAAEDYVKNGPDFSRRCCPKCGGLNAVSAAVLLAGVPRLLRWPSLLNLWMGEKPSITERQAVKRRWVRSDAEWKRAFHCPDCAVFFDRDSAGNPVSDSGSSEVRNPDTPAKRWKWRRRGVIAALLIAAVGAVVWETAQDNSRMEPYRGFLQEFPVPVQVISMDDKMEHFIMRFQTGVSEEDRESILRKFAARILRDHRELKQVRIEWQIGSNPERAQVVTVRREAGL